MDREQALNRVIELAFKWQQKHEWAAAFKAADRFREYRDKVTERFNNLADERHSQVIAAHSEFIAMENLLRQHAPQFLELVPGVNFFTDSAADHSPQIQNVKRLEGAVRQLCDTKETPPESANNPWKQARDADSKITIADQMMLLFKRDDSIVDRKNLSAEVAKILGCSSPAVRHADNASWKYYQAEQARRKELRQALKGKNSPQYRNGQRLAKSDEEDADD